MNFGNYDVVIWGKYLPKICKVSWEDSVCEFAQTHRVNPVQNPHDIHAFHMRKQAVLWLSNRHRTSAVSDCQTSADARMTEDVEG